MTLHTIFWNVPYTFSGKEKDVETGYGYFGARYYDSGLSIWLSVDTMSDKYPSMSPYYVKQEGDNIFGVINLSHNTSGVFSHELKHAFQFDNKEVSYLSDGKSLSTLSRFYTKGEAYKRGQAFGQDYVSDNSIRNKYSTISCRIDKVSLNYQYGVQEILPKLVKNNEFYKR